MNVQLANDGRSQFLEDFEDCLCEIEFFDIQKKPNKYGGKSKGDKESVAKCMGRICQDDQRARNLVKDDSIKTVSVAIEPGCKIQVGFKFKLGQKRFRTILPGNDIMSEDGCSIYYTELYGEESKGVK